MRIVNVRETRTQISRLLDAVERGEEIIIKRNGKLTARLTPYEDDDDEQKKFRFPDRTALRRSLPACSESSAATVRALRDDERF